MEFNPADQIGRTWINRRELSLQHRKSLEQSLTGANVFRVFAKHQGDYREWKGNKLNWKSFWIKRHWSHYRDPCILIQGN